MGGDRRVDQAAGVSLAKFERDRTDEEVRRIVRYMMKHRHGTPFEHSVFTFRVRAPIFVVREWMRHRMGSYNEMSLRYTESDGEFYVPSILRQPTESNRQGSIDMAPSPLEEKYRKVMTLTMENSVAVYDFLVRSGVANEVARMVLPLSVYTEFVWTVNARALMNFLSLRMGIDAQVEIREYAGRIMEIFEEQMPITAQAFAKNGYIAP